jgi:hypothetical protein
MAKFIERKCKNCEFNIKRKCTGHGSTYKYGETITDTNKVCDDWDADLEYFSYITEKAPRFLREAYDESKISYNDLVVSLDKMDNSEAVSISLFDAIKSVYGLSMVDIAMILDVSYGVVLSAKQKGIPAKRLDHFSNVLCIPKDLLSNPTTLDFEKLEKCNNAFYELQKENKGRINVPTWVKNISAILVQQINIPQDIAFDVSRIDKMIWTPEYDIEEYTACERKFITWVCNANKDSNIVSINYFLDNACLPHLKLKTSI